MTLCALVTVVLTGALPFTSRSCWGSFSSFFGGFAMSDLHDAFNKLRDTPLGKIADNLGYLCLAWSWLELEVTATACALMEPLELDASSEERRVGKECVSTCSSRWWTYH